MELFAYDQPLSEFEYFTAKYLRLNSGASAQLDGYCTPTLIRSEVELRILELVVEALQNRTELHVLICQNTYMDACVTMYNIIERAAFVKTFPTRRTKDSCDFGPSIKIRSARPKQYASEMRVDVPIISCAVYLYPRLETAFLRRAGKVPAGFFTALTQQYPGRCDSTVIWPRERANVALVELIRSTTLPADLIRIVAKYLRW